MSSNNVQYTSISSDWEQLQANCSFISARAPSASFTGIGRQWQKNLEEKIPKFGAKAIKELKLDRCCLGKRGRGSQPFFGGFRLGFSHSFKKRRESRMCVMVGTATKICSSRSQMWSMCPVSAIDAGTSGKGNNRDRQGYSVKCSCLGLPQQDTSPTSPGLAFVEKALPSLGRWHQQGRV